jgi:hypothetical protein
MRDHADHPYQSYPYRYQSWHPLHRRRIFIFLYISGVQPLSIYNTENTMSESQPKSSASPWVILAVTSGAFAALNGVFAKL